MSKSFNYFRKLEYLITSFIKARDYEAASKLINQYTHERVQKFRQQQGEFYGKLLGETGSNHITAAKDSQKLGQDFSASTAAKFARKQAVPNFLSLAKLMEERQHEVLIILEPFEEKAARNLWVRFSARDNVATSIASLAKGLSRQHPTDRVLLAKLSGLSVSTIRLAENQTTNPLYSEHVACHSVETLCRLAAAHQYRLSILFCKPKRPGEFAA